MFAMNLLNRALVIVLLVVLLVGGLAMAIAPAFVAGQLRGWATTLETADRLQLLGAGIVLVLVALALLVLELRRRGPAAVALAGESGASLSTDTVVQQLRHDVEAVPDVVRARPVVTARRGGVDVQLAVDTTGGVDVPTKATEIRQIAAGTVERLGLKLGRLTVNLSQRGASPLGPPTSGGSETAS
jgi:hypothetical protein